MHFWLTSTATPPPTAYAPLRPRHSRPPAPSPPPPSRKPPSFKTCGAKPSIPNPSPNISPNPSPDQATLLFFLRWRSSLLRRRHTFASHASPQYLLQVCFIEKTAGPFVFGLRCRRLTPTLLCHRTSILHLMCFFFQNAEVTASCEFMINIRALLLRSSLSLTPLTDVLSSASNI
ncbi:unnamed protein product [Amaranthus hypochondriacus]